MAATMATPLHRIEIVAERRRAHDDGFRAAMVAQSLVPGVRVRDLARRHGICASLIYRWRREQAQTRPGDGLRLLPVEVTPVGPAARQPSGSSPAPALAPDRRAGSIEIELDDGIRVHVGDDVSLVALRRVMTALRR